jgi:AcrR family transcriptional regulator
VGYDRVNMAGVATRAGTNKAALYRRWPNRTELLAMAIDRRVSASTPDPSTPAISATTYSPSSEP